MEHNHEKLYETFGELLYVVAMADGLIQDEEVSTLENILAEHPWATDIKWSFNYERKKKRGVEEVYARVLDYCTNAGPSPEYQNMIEVMEAMAKASNGVDADEKEVMDTFTNTLIQKFKEDIQGIR
ncbi:MAG: tellurite resistance protein [Aureispira sp.]|jgi:tellurite resistance protein